MKKENTKFLKGKPKQDGSGKGIRANKGRGGCEITKDIGRNTKNLLVGTGAVILGIKGAELLGGL